MLEQVINSQSSEGYWTDEGILMQIANIAGKVTLTIEMVQAALNVEVKSEHLTRVVLTVVALWVLIKKFEEKEAEWQMIARKAKNYLKLHGITTLEAIY